MDTILLHRDDEDRLYWRRESPEGKVTKQGAKAGYPNLAKAVEAVKREGRKGDPRVVYENGRSNGAPVTLYEPEEPEPAVAGEP